MLEEASEPILEFMIKHSDQSEREFFLRATMDLWPDTYSATISDRNLLILLPAFIMSELKAAQEAQRGNYSRAIKHCEAILSKEPDNIDALLRLGTFLNTTKQFDQAELKFKKAISSDAQNIDARAYYSLGIAQYGQKKYNDAKY